MKKERLNVYFDPALSFELEALAARRKVSKSQIVEAALAAFLSPDGADQREAAIVRRLDRLTRAVERLERDLSIGNEAMALFVKFWLTTTPPLPEEIREAAQASGKEVIRVGLPVHVHTNVGMAHHTAELAHLHPFGGFLRLCSFE